MGCLKIGDARIVGIVKLRCINPICVMVKTWYMSYGHPAIIQPMMGILIMTYSNWWFQPPWKIVRSSQLLGKITNVPNHQPVLDNMSRYNRNPRLALRMSEAPFVTKPGNKKPHPLFTSPCCLQENNAIIMSKNAGHYIRTTLPWKAHQKHRVSRPRVFSPKNSCSAEMLHFPTTSWSMVDMMMWWTCWWEC